MKVSPSYDYNLELIFNSTLLSNLIQNGNDCKKGLFLALDHS